MSDLAELISKVEADLENRIADAQNASVTVRHVETSVSKNESTFEIDAKLGDLFPESFEDSEYADSEVSEFKITISPDERFLNYDQAELRKC